MTTNPTTFNSPHDKPSTWANGVQGTWGNGSWGKWSGQWTNPGLNHWRSVLAQKAAGQIVRPRILCVGDSTTFGCGSNGTLATGDLKSNAWPTQLAALFNTNGISAQSNSIVANGFTANGLSSVNDPRLSAGASWSTTTTKSVTVGGYSLTHNSSTYNGNTYTFSGVDTFRVWYPVIGTTNGPGGNLKMSVDGGAVTTQSTSSGGSADGTPAYIDIAAGTVGTHTLTITTDSPNLTFVISVEGFNSSSSQISIMNAGISSSVVASWITATYPWSPLNLIGSMGQDLTIIGLNINDAYFGTALPTYQSQLQKLINAAKSGGGDVLLVTEMPESIGNIPQATQQGYVDIVKMLARANNLTVIDTFANVGTWVSANSNGWMFDGAHPNASGYAHYVSLIYPTISAP